MTRSELQALPLDLLTSRAHTVREATARRHGWAPPARGPLPKWLLVEILLAEEVRQRNEPG